MKRKIYADTNVWYGLGTGAIAKSALIGSDEALWATPINLLEIVGGVKIGNWTGRQVAASAIIKFGDGIATDPESHILACMGGVSDFESYSWDDVCRAMSTASDIQELENGVPDYFERVRRSVEVDKFATMKTEHYEAFALKVARACDGLVDGYLPAYQEKTKTPKLNKALREKFRQHARSAPFVEVLLRAGLGVRYQQVTNQSLDLSDEHVVARLVESFTSYGRIYAGYIAELVTTGRKPDVNDWGALELFLYLQGDARVITAEKKWWSIADAAGVGALVQRVSTGHQ